MLYCPQCGTEHREGYSSCSDCHALLVPERPKPNKQITPSLGDFRVIWRGLSQNGCVNTCYKLQDLGVPYTVDDKKGSLWYRMTYHRRYEIFVSNADYERAKSGLELEDDLPQTISEQEWQEMEHPVDSDELQAPEGFEEKPQSVELDRGDLLPDTPERRDAYFRDWWPEDATVKIWRQGTDKDISFGLEMALKENLIHFRLDGDDNGKTFFVMPEDESRAREIVRQIIEATPPE